MLRILSSILKTIQHLRIARVFTNNPKAGVIERLAWTKIKTTVFDKVQLTNGQLITQIKRWNPDLIVLAGFLLKIPLDFTQAFTGSNHQYSPFPTCQNTGEKACMARGFIERLKKQETKRQGSRIHLCK